MSIGQHADGGAAPHPHKHSIRPYIVGYVFSLLLTAAAFSLALTHAMKYGPLLLVLIGLAGLQILVQLFFFMHVTEGDRPHWHVVALALALLFAFAFALMSIWIMSFGAAYNLVQ